MTTDSRFFPTTASVYRTLTSSKRQGVTKAPTFSTMHVVQSVSLSRRLSCDNLLIAASRLVLSLGSDPGSVMTCNRGIRVSGRINKYQV